MGLLLLVAIAVFLVLAADLTQRRLQAFDEAILLSMRVPGNPKDPIGPFWFEGFVRDVTALGSRGILGLVVLAVAGFLVLNGRVLRAFSVLAYTLGGSLVGEIAKAWFARPRPDLVPHGVDVVSLSFPSAHALQAGVVYLTLGALLARTQPERRVRRFILFIAVTIVIMVGASRIYLGVHWPSDVVAGWALGAAWAALCWLVDVRLRSRSSLKRTSKARTR